MILRADWVAPVSRPILRDGYVEIREGRIARLGRASDLAAHEPVEDLGAAILLPGLVNPHTHLELTGYAGRLAPGPFWSWIEGLIELRAAPGQIERETAAVLDGAARSLRAGVTCVGDVSRRNLAWRALQRAPIRKVCFVELLTLADQPPRTLAELLAEVRSVEEDDLLTVGVSAHAPYSVPADDLSASVALARRLGRPWCSHWAETKEEVAFLRDAAPLRPALARRMAERGVTSPRMGPTAYLRRCLAQARDGPVRTGPASAALLAHVNYIDDGGVAELASSGAAVVYCPRAHRFFGHEPHRFMDMRAGGVRVAVGTDSLASNASLAPLEELRFLVRARADAPPPEDLVRLVTLDAAAALGLASRIGSLDPGKEADLAAFPCEAGEREPLRALIEGSPAASGVWVAGRRAWSD